MASLDPVWQLAAAFVGDRDPRSRVDSLFDDRSARRPVRISGARLSGQAARAAADALAQEVVADRARRISDLIARHRRSALVRAATRARARRLGVPAAVLDAAEYALEKHHAAIDSALGHRTVAQAREQLSRLAMDISRASARSLAPDAGDDGVTVELSEGGVDLVFPGSSAGIIIVAIIIAILLAASLFFEQRQDHDTREALDALSCEDVIATPDEEILDAFQVLLGITSSSVDATANRDERSMLRVLGCLPAGRVRNVVGTIEARMLLRFEGPELTQLARLLVERGPMNIGTWAASASRKFIRAAGANILSSLTADHCHALFVQIFRGWTGELDEAAVLTLLGAMDCASVTFVAGQVGTTPRDFQRNLNGREQRSAQDIFRRCGVG